jgi:hypothetical protein
MIVMGKLNIRDLSFFQPGLHAHCTIGVRF